MTHILWIPSWYPTKETPHCGIYFKEQLRALSSRGLQVGVLAPEVRSLRQFSLKLLSDNYFQSSIDDDIYTLRHHGWNLSPFYEPGQMEQWCFFAEHLMKKYIAAQGLPDLIHAQSVYWAGVAARRLSLKYNIPYCLTEHRGDIRKRKCLKAPAEKCWSLPYIKKVYNDASALIAVSSPLKEAMLIYTDRPADEIEIIPNSVDPQFFSIDLERSTPFTYLTVANLIPEKNISLLLSAFQMISKEYPESRLIIVGDGLERQKLESNSNSSVTFTGNISRSAVRSAYQEAHAFVLPSNNESFSVVCIEALAAGIPVIATACGGPEDIIKPDLGILVPPKNVQTLAEAMKRVQSHPQSFSASKLREEALSKYCPDSIAAKQKSIYDRILC